MSRFRREPIIGWRSWRFSISQQQLVSCIRQTTWPACERLEAECLTGTAGTMRCRHAPQEDCSCGIYAWTERKSLKRMVRITPDSIPVWGSVSLWGDVVEHEDGVRAEFAYPYELFVSERHEDVARRLRDFYRVDVVRVPLPQPFDG